MGTRIFWILMIAFLCGVFVRTLIPLGYLTILFFTLAGAISASVYAFARARATIFFSIALLAFSLGALRMHTGIIERDPLLDVALDSKVTLEGIVQNEPDARENSVRIALRVVSIGGAQTTEDVSALIVAPLHAEVAYGDRIRAEGKLALPEVFETGEGRVFDYPGFLAKDRILYQMSFAKVTRLEGNEGNLLKSWAINVKQAYLDGLANALAEPQAGLAGGITVGDKRGLGEELSETFRIVGLTHIVVLSGYNIMVVVDALLRWLARSPQAVRLSLAAFVAFFFAAITGFASASTRAAAMAMIAITGKATGRTYLASRALILVAAAMVAWNPYLLVYDPGFQLSIVATAGLISLTPLFATRLGFITEKFGLREIAAATLGTQLAVLPLLLYQNGQLSLFALPANLLALVVIPWAMLLSAIAALFGIFTGIIAPFFGFPAYVLLSYVIYVAKLFAALPFASLSLPAFSVWYLTIVYAVIAAVVIKKNTAGS